MSDKSASQEDNVVSLFTSRKKLSEKVNLNPKEDSSDEESFADVMLRNKQTADRLKKDREKNNKSVLRSYRIKN